MINIFFSLTSIFSTDQGCNLSKDVPFFTFKLEMRFGIKYAFPKHLPARIKKVKSESFEIFNRHHKNVFSFSCIQMKHKRSECVETLYWHNFSVKEFLIMPVFTSEMYGIGSYNVYENDFYVYKTLFILENINKNLDEEYIFSVDYFLRKVIYDNFAKPLEEDLDGFTDSLTDFIDYLNQKDSKFLENFDKEYPLLSEITFADLKSNLNYILTFSKEIKEDFKGTERYNYNLNIYSFDQFYRLFFLQKDIKKNSFYINSSKICFLITLQDMINLFNHHKNLKIRESKNKIKWEIWDVLCEGTDLKINIKNIIFYN